MRNKRDDSVISKEKWNEPKDGDMQSLLPWPQWEPRSRRTLRRRPDEELEALLRCQVQRLVVAVGVVCGTNSSTARLVARAAYGTATDRSERLRQFGLAKYALDELPPSNRNRIRAVKEGRDAGGHAVHIVHTWKGDTADE